jgi:hypothetical protein
LQLYFVGAMQGEPALDLTLLSRSAFEELASSRRRMVSKR